MIKDKLRSNLSILVMLLFHILFGLVAKAVSDWIPWAGLIIFMVGYALLLVTTFSLKENEVLKFFNTFLYLGFYLKFCFHAVFSYPYSEPIGAFTGSVAELNEYFQISTVAALSISLCCLLIARYLKKREVKATFNLAQLHFLTSKFKIFFWFILIASITLAFINLKLGLIISGVASVTVLPSPLNAIIGFFLYSGFSILIAVNGLFEFEATKRLNYTSTLVILEGLISSIALISRGSFLFHFFPYLICLFIFRKQFLLSFKNLLVVAVTGGVFFIVSGFFVTSARTVLYNNYNLNHSDYMSKNLFDFFGDHHRNGDLAEEVEEIEPLEVDDESFYQSNRSIIFGSNHSKRSRYKNCSTKLCVQVSSFATQMSQLMIDRWIGSEGLMAVTSYPEKDIHLIYSSLVRVPKVGDKDIFEKMNRSFYPFSTKYVFTSLPGPVAFFYYSGMGWVVFFGMFIFVLLLYGLQQISTFILSNVFLRFQTAFIFAISFMQFGISPKPLVVSFIMLFSFLIAIRVAMALCERQKETRTA